MHTRARSIFLLIVMLSGSGIALALRPTHRIADTGPKLVLENIVPTQFAGWKIDTRLIPVSVTPDVQEQLNILYDQTLSRTYISNEGRQVMLSIAYGGDQSGDKTQVHRPEFCYAAQGFQLSNVFESEINVDASFLPVRRLLAVKGNQREPITYWITIGDQVTLPGIDRKLIQLRYGITGKIPDGMLIRVSSIDQNSSTAYQLQDRFVRDLLAAISEQDRIRMAGHSIH